MKKYVIIILICILIFLFYFLSLDDVSSNSGNIYYIANDGDDSNTGLSADSPWKTIEKVNMELNSGCINQGNNIYFKRGDSWNYPSSLTLYIGGAPANEMIIGAYGVGDKPRLSGQGPQAIFCDRGIGYVTIQDLNFTENGKRSIFFYNGCNAHNITLRNLEIFNPGDSGGEVITFFNTKDVLIENCNINVNNEVQHGISIQHYGGGNNQCGNFIIRNCTIKNVKDGISIHYGDTTENNSLGNNFWIENCTISNTAEECIDVVGGYGCENVFIQNCEMYDCGNFVVGHGQANVVVDNVYIHDVKGNGFTLTRCYNVILRNSVIYKWGSGKNGICKNANQYAPDETNNICFYNNDIISNNDDYIQIDNDNINGFIFKNNIFYSTATSNPGLFTSYTSSATFSNTNSDFSYNMWWRGDGGSGDDTWWGDAGGSYDLNEWLALDEVSNDLRDDPELTNPSGGDFSLSSSSPCIDAGDWLTSCNGGGSGTVITVDEAGFFFSGISDFDVSGDNIFVGDDTDLEVVAVDYSAETITVDRIISWNDGDRISLSSYTGSAPDIGAGESFYSTTDNLTNKIESGEINYFIIYFLIICVLIIFTFVILARKF